MPGWHGYKAHRVAKGMPKGIGYHIGGRFPMLRQRYNPTGDGIGAHMAMWSNVAPRERRLQMSILNPARARGPHTRAFRPTSLI